MSYIVLKKVLFVFNRVECWRNEHFSVDSFTNRQKFTFVELSITVVILLNLDLYQELYSKNAVKLSFFFFWWTVSVKIEEKAFEYKLWKKTHDITFSNLMNTKVVETRKKCEEIYYKHFYFEKENCENLQNPRSE